MKKILTTITNCLAKRFSHKKTKKIFGEVIENSGQFTATRSKNITTLSFAHPTHPSVSSIKLSK